MALDRDICIKKLKHDTADRDPMQHRRPLVLEGGFGDETMAVDFPQTNPCAAQSHMLYWA